MKRSNRRPAERLQLPLLAVALTLFAGTAIAQDAVVTHDAVLARDTLVAHDAVVERDALNERDMEPIGWEGKLRFHAVSAYGPAALAGAAVYDGFLQGIDFPREWGQGGLGYSKRLGSTLAYSGVRNLLGFGLDSALRQDPRYYRSTERGTWRRTKHAFRDHPHP